MTAGQNTIKAKHVRNAAARWDNKPGIRGFRKGSKYEVWIDGKSYPPKAIASIANELAGNGLLYPRDFAGAWEGPWHSRLASAGFKPCPKSADRNTNSLDQGIRNVDTIFDILNEERFSTCQRAFLVTGRPGREKINETLLKNNQSGDWRFNIKKRGAKVGDALFILLPSPMGGYPRQVFSGLITEFLINRDQSIRFKVDEFKEHPKVESRLRSFLGGQIPARGKNVLTILDNRVKQTTSSRHKIDIDDEHQFPEGQERKRFKEHIRRERNPRVIRLAKEARLALDKGLSCEACGFDFAKIYGNDGFGFIEGHHTTPIHQMKAGHKTKISEIALVCSNCHRMLHRIKPLLTVEEFTKRFNNE